MKITDQEFHRRNKDSLHLQRTSPFVETVELSYLWLKSVYFTNNRLLPQWGPTYNVIGQKQANSSKLSRNVNVDYGELIIALMILNTIRKIYQFCLFVW